MNLYNISNDYCKTKNISCVQCNDKIDTQNHYLIQNLKTTPQYFDILHYNYYLDSNKGIGIHQNCYDMITNVFNLPNDLSISIHKQNDSCKKFNIYCISCNNLTYTQEHYLISNNKNFIINIKIFNQEESLSPEHSIAIHKSCYKNLTSIFNINQNLSILTHTKDM